MLKQSQNLSTVKKRWCYSQTVPKPANSQKKMVQFSNRTNLSPVIKRCKILKQSQNLSTVKTRWCNSQTEQTCHQSEKDGTILKQSKKLPPVRKRWYNTQTDPILSPVRKRWNNTETVQKPVTSQKKMA